MSVEAQTSSPYKTPDCSSQHPWTGIADGRPYSVTSCLTQEELPDVLSGKGGVLVLPPAGHMTVPPQLDEVTVTLELVPGAYFPELAAGRGAPIFRGPLSHDAATATFDQTVVIRKLRTGDVLVDDHASTVLSWGYRAVPTPTATVAVTSTMKLPSAWATEMAAPYTGEAHTSLVSNAENIVKDHPRETVASTLLGLALLAGGIRVYLKKR